jgi:hypothetical protein
LVCKGATVTSPTTMHMLCWYRALPSPWVGMLIDGTYHGQVLDPRSPPARTAQQSLIRSGTAVAERKSCVRGWGLFGGRRGIHWHGSLNSTQHTSRPFPPLPTTMCFSSFVPPPLPLRRCAHVFLTPHPILRCRLLHVHVHTYPHAVPPPSPPSPPPPPVRSPPSTTAVADSVILGALRGVGTPPLSPSGGAASTGHGGLGIGTGVRIGGFRSPTGGGIGATDPGNSGGASGGAGAATTAMIAGGGAGQGARQAGSAASLLAPAMLGASADGTSMYSSSGGGAGQGAAVLPTLRAAPSLRNSAVGKGNPMVAPLDMV